ncbi:uncharacterized protein LOC128204181 isoform X1 [Mya arenaria]|uniref:uncharacterized protein LOC128204181 isoform X1 n=2 Tax=Mya arenaria TaxID=6604 RepID=UPI0022E0181D|nr:uncharacterized protein LOC128204181 isoform X1 [Mya arenaria]
MTGLEQVFCSLSVKMANPNEPVLLYAHPTMRTLAKQIALQCSLRAKMGTDSHPPETLNIPQQSPEKKPKLSFHRSLSRGNLLPGSRCVEYRDTIRWEKFQDGFPNLFIEDVHRMMGKDVIFLGSFHDPSVIFEQLSVLYMFPRYLARSFHFILPYFPTGTMERVDTEGQIATAKTLASMMSAIPLTARGPVQICIFDIHALQERFYFSDNIIPRLESAIPMLLETIIGLPDKDKIAVAFPDDGAFKRFHQFFPDYDTVTCVKIRDGNTRIVKVKDGNPEGKHVVIVDDLVQTGGTLINCGKALVDKGATDVSAYATHAVFPNDSWKKFTDNDDFKFKNFWITDSIPHAVEISKHEPFKLLSLCESISRMLMVYDLKQET